MLASPLGDGPAFARAWEAGLHRAWRSRASNKPRPHPLPVPPAFGITIYDEGPDQLDWCLRHLRAVYPSATVFVISDGSDLPAYREVCQHHSATYHPGERLKLLGHGAAWWKRFFGLAAECNANHVFKLDPDAQLVRPFRFFPSLDVFGTLDGCIVQGGVQGFSAAAVFRILESEVCDDPEYGSISTWAFDGTSQEYAQVKGQISTDYVLHHIVQRLSMRQGQWNEVDSLYEPTRPFRPGVAATHPHKGAASAIVNRILDDR
jgi:hypothetical protein